MWPEMRTSRQHCPEGATHQPVKHSLLLMFLLLSREHQHLSRLLQEGRRQEGRQGAEMGQEEDGSFLGIHGIHEADRGAPHPRPPA